MVKELGFPALEVRGCELDGPSWIEARGEGGEELWGETTPTTTNDDRGDASLTLSLSLSLDVTRGDHSPLTLSLPS